MPCDSSTDAERTPALHVLHVADRDFFARFGRMFRQLALALIEDGVRVSLVSDDAPAIADLDATPVECLPVARLLGWRAQSRARRVLERCDPPPTLLHVWGTCPLEAIRGWARAGHLPVLIHALSSADIRRLTQHHRQPNQYVAAACARFYEAGRQRWPAAADAVHLVVPALLAPETVAGVAPAPHTLGVLWNGRVNDARDLGVLLDAVTLLRRKDHDLQVALVGSGPAAPPVWGAIRARRVHDCVSLIDEPALWDQAMRGADVLVVPTCQHDLSLAPLLAMALGKVVITSRDQFAEWFREDGTCWQFTPGSAVELAYHLSRVAGEPDKVASLTRSASQYVREHHNVMHVATRLIEVYRAMAATPAASTVQGEAP